MRLRHGAARKRAAGALACRLQLSAVQQRRAGEGAALRRGAGMPAGGRARAVPRGDAACLPARARPPSPWPPSSHCFPLEGSQAGPLGRERMSQGHKCHCRGKGVPRAGPLSMSPENVFQAGPAGWPPRCLRYIWHPAFDISRIAGQLASARHSVNDHIYAPKTEGQPGVCESAPAPETSQQQKHLTGELNLSSTRLSKLNLMSL